MVQRKKIKMSAEMWIEIRIAYVQGNENEQGQRTYPSLETLAKANGIHWNTIHRKSKLENWKDERAIFETKMIQDSDSKKRKEIINQSVQFDLDSLRLARSLQATIANVLTEDNQKAQEVRQRKQLDPKRQLTLRQTDPIDLLKASEINSLSMALEKAQKVGRLAFGESTENANITTNTETISRELHEAYETIQELFSPNKDSSQIKH